MVRGWAGGGLAVLVVDGTQLTGFRLVARLEHSCPVGSSVLQHLSLVFQFQAFLVHQAWKRWLGIPSHGCVLDAEVQ